MDRFATMRKPAHGDSCVVRRSKGDSTTIASAVITNGIDVASAPVAHITRVDVIAEQPAAVPADGVTLTALPVVGAERELTDLDLILAFRAGDPTAFETLFDRHAQHLRGMCRRIIRDPDTSEDVVQETFARFLGVLHRLDSASNIRALLRRIAANLCANELRRNFRAMRLNGHPTEVDAPGSQDMADDDQLRQPEAAHDIADLRQRILEVSRRLPERERRVLVLHEIHRMSYLQIAAEMGISVAAVDALLHRMRERFRREFVGLYSDPSLPSQCAETIFVVEQLHWSNMRAGQKRRITRHVETCANCAARFASENGALRRSIPTGGAPSTVAG